MQIIKKSVNKWRTVATCGGYKGTPVYIETIITRDVGVGHYASYKGWSITKADYSTDSLEPTINRVFEYFKNNPGKPQ